MKIVVSAVLLQIVIKEYFFKKLKHVIHDIYIDLIRADKRLIKKFGDEYKKHMQKVPRANFFIGVIRVLQRKSKEI